MATWMRAKICWLSAEEGGRSAPPPGPTYSTAARFDRLREQWPHEAWSVVAEFLGAPDDHRCLVARVRLLSAEGSRELLHPGSGFDLFEGKKLVARCVVIGPEP